MAGTDRGGYEGRRELRGVTTAAALRAILSPHRARR